jgi:hypothetical protein
MIAERWWANIPYLVLIDIEMVCRFGVCYSLIRFLFACTGLHIVVYTSIVSPFLPSLSVA